ncbi:RNA-directed DNA polymerase, eukaryota, reverse transcriptase zinc-binding domain protein [Tanacetum coccineum]|uniref:RNA-directed DNA polymerase, eukaryota, reverse transcriptase zinc-binding domain protein n=1 Tax=Tanacetum coccineum TaxID=301880 RepID=A0ABQ5BZ93_9ASTR
MMAGSRGDLEELIKEVSLNENRRDGWKLRLDPSGVFFVRSLSHWIEERHASRMLGVKKPRWINVVLGKVNVFVWRAILGRLPVRVELDKRGIDLDSILCLCCENIMDLIDHSLVLCDKALKCGIGFLLGGGLAMLMRLIKKTCWVITG